MLSRAEIKRRQERVLALLRRENCWVSMVRIAHGSDLTYDTVRPVLEALARTGLIERQSEGRNTFWGLANLSERERAERLEVLEQKKPNASARKSSGNAKRKTSPRTNTWLGWIKWPARRLGGNEWLPWRVGDKTDDAR